MSFLPIVERELRVTSRRKAFYWARWGAAVLFVALGGLRLLSFYGLSSTQMSQLLFRALTEVAFFLCLGSGVLLTADCLSVEKRENTLGLLFLTDLKGEDVVLGKMAAHALTAFHGLLAIYPMLAVPLVIGGVSFGEFVRITLVLTNTFFFSLAAGVLVSALTQNERTAMTGTFLFVLLVALILPMMGVFVLAIFEPGQWNVGVLRGYKGLAFSLAHYGVYERNPMAFWQTLLGSHLLAWTFIGVAAWEIRAEVRGSHRVLAGAAAQCQLELPAKREARLRYRRKMLDLNPMLWLTGRDAWKPTAVWIALGVLFTAWCLGLAIWHWTWLVVSAIPSVFFLHALLKVWVASEASHRLVEDHRSGALELLLSTPMSSKRIVSGQRWAIQRQFANPIYAVLVFDACVAIPGLLWYDPPQLKASLAGPVIFSAIGLMMFLLVDDIKTLTVTGMQMGLRQTRADRAWLATVTRVLIVPWLVWVLPATSITNYRLGGGNAMLIIFGGFANAVYNGYLREVAEEFLENDFRRAAAERFEVKQVEREAGQEPEVSVSAV